MLLPVIISSALSQIIAISASDVPSSIETSTSMKSKNYANTHGSTIYLPIDSEPHFNSACTFQVMLPIHRKYELLFI